MNQNLLFKIYIRKSLSKERKKKLQHGLMPMPLISKNLCHSAKSYDALVWQDADELKTGVTSCFHYALLR